MINQKADLCDQIKNVDLECPLKKGETILTKEVDLPKEIPPVCLVVLITSLWFAPSWKAPGYHDAWVYKDMNSSVLIEIIIQGKYTVLADVYTVDDRKITCLQASIQFHR